MHVQSQLIYETWTNSLLLAHVHEELAAASAARICSLNL